MRAHGELFAHRTHAIASPSAAAFALVPPDCLDLTLPRFEPLVDVSSMLGAIGQVDFGRYGDPQGLEDLRSLVATEYHVAARDVTITAGASEALAVTLASLVEPGMRVALPRPAFPGYEPLVKFWGGIPVPYALRAGGGSQAAVLDALDGVRVVIVSSPHNPTGSVIGADTWRLLLDRAARAGTWVVSDEAYGSMAYGAPHIGLRDVNAGDPERHVILDGISKRLGLPSLRVGWLVTENRELTSRVAQIRVHSSMGVDVLGQLIALRALGTVNSELFTVRRGVLARNAAIVADALRESGGLHEPPNGTPFVYVTGPSSASPLALYEAARRHGVAGFPGILFHDSRSALRLSVLAPTEIVSRAAAVLRTTFEHWESPNEDLESRDQSH
jgi:aspartate/methionine/tyrosine aminotransferase